MEDNDYRCITGSFRDARVLLLQGATEARAVQSGNRDGLT